MPFSFSPTPAETTLVHQVFQHADPQKLGVVTGDAAVKVFDGAKLQPAVLAEIWSMADDENNGWLSKKGVAKAVRLIGWAQAGRKVSEDLLEKPGPLAKIEGINSVAQQNTGVSLPKSPLPLFPALTPQDRDKYLNIFRRAGPVGGLLSGDKSRDIFLKSKLPNDQLLQIWNLADTQDRGALDQVDFAIGMFFINGLMSKTISFIPTSLPPGLYQQAGGAVASHLSGNSGQFSPQHSSFSIQPQSTGQRSQVLQPNHTGMSGSSIPPRSAPALPARPSALASPFQTPVQPAPQPWDVTPAEKTTFDGWFDNLDTQKLGFIEGDVAVPFMLQSGLPGEILATVWDLSDLNNDGRLTRDGFAVAMHLIQKKLAGTEIPSQLPQSLIPPSMRSRIGQQQPAAPPVPEPVKDLFSFDDSPPPSAVSPQPTGVFPPPLQPQQTGPLSVLRSQRTGAKSPQPDPFRQQPVAPTYTGSPANFLDDDEPAPPAQSFQDKSAEIGNTKNQLNSTTMSLEAARAERRNLEDKVAEQTQQLQSLQMQLSTAKASYEGESNTLTSLKERHAGQQAEITKTREELIRAESDLSALKVERSEIEGTFLRDKEDARDLHRRMIETGKEADAIKAEVEKLKKDAKQQKGLLAIAKKQLSSKEADRAKAQKEYEEATAELNAITKEQAEVDAAITSIDASPVPTFVPSASPVLSQTSPVTAPFERVASPADSLSFAAAQPLPLTPDVTAASPSTSTRSNNPFDRLKAGNSTPRSQAPFAAFPSPSATLWSEPQPALDGDNIFDTKPFVEEPKAESLEGLAYDSPEPAQLATLEVPNGQLAPDDTPASPNTANETEFFHTPPTSAHLSPSLEAKAYPAIDDFTSTFALDELPKAPEVDKVESKENEDKPKAAASNDFDAAFSFDDNSHAKELEVDESDSDSEEEDEDEVPLSKVRQSVILAQQDKAAALEAPPERADSFDDIFGGEPPKAEETQKPEVAQTENTFDDIFGGPIASPQTNGLPHPNAASPAVAGVDAFDEALGKISPTSSAAPVAQPFSFDSAFEDNFDFAAAKEEQGPSSAGSAPAPALAAATPAAHSTFDSIFTASGLNGHAEALKPVAASAPVPQPAQPADPSASVNISFDDAFANDLASTLNPPAAAAQRSPSPKPSIAPQTLSPPTNGASNNPFPTVSPTASPSAIAAPRPSSAHQRPASPFQAERILPQRTGSPVPKPRLSTSSSKEAASEKPKEPAPRHSKISLRLPFGRKKKQQQQQQQQHEPMPPPPSTHLSPMPEQIERTPTPAVDDDVEPVKVLTAMGFSRGQAVAALEQYGYNVQLALNSLLAQSS